MTRGRGEGIIEEKGEAFAGTVIKDTWTITRGGLKWEGDVEGRGDRDGWREKAENYLNNNKKMLKNKKNGNMALIYPVIF